MKKPTMDELLDMVGKYLEALPAGLRLFDERCYWRPPRKLEPEPVPRVRYTQEYKFRGVVVFERRRWWQYLGWKYLRYRFRMWRWRRNGTWQRVCDEVKAELDRKIDRML